MVAIGSCNHFLDALFDVGMEFDFTEAGLLVPEDFRKLAARGDSTSPDFG
jgi:hypothetical protein